MAFDSRGVNTEPTPQHTLLLSRLLKQEERRRDQGGDPVGRCLNPEVARSLA